MCFNCMLSTTLISQSPIYAQHACKWEQPMFRRWITLTLLLTATVPGSADDDVGSASIPAQLSPWLQPQN